MSSAPAKIGLVLAGAARDAMVTALVQSGYEVYLASNCVRVQSLIANGDVDAWVFDARSDEDILDLLLATGSFLLPADNIPDPGERAAITRWVDGLLTQLSVALSGDATQDSAGKSYGWSEVRGVWLLAGSAGATSAIQAFLNAFTQPPPVAFLYAQHLDPAQHHQLQRFTVQNRQFSLRVSEGIQSLVPGRLVMISPRCKIALNAFGQVTSTREPWEGEHAPDINELLVILSAAKIPSPGVIIFSGMGNDGAASLHIFEAAGGRVWAQSTDSAVCPAMPQAALDTGLVQKSVEPMVLAAALEKLYSP